MNATPESTDAAKTTLLESIVAARQWTAVAQSLAARGKLGPWVGAGQALPAMVAAAASLQATDWIVADPRGSVLLPLRGVPLATWFLDLLGREGGQGKGHAAPGEHSAASARFLGGSALLGTQLAQAAGLAHAARAAGKGEAVLAIAGEAAAATGDFHVGLNFAGVFRSPLVVLILRGVAGGEGRLAGADTQARGRAYGVVGQRVSGSDLWGLREAVAAALDRARTGGGASIIECAIGEDDGLDGLHSALHDDGVDPQALEQRCAEVAHAQASAAARDAERHPLPAADSLFDDVYAAPDARLLAQRHDLQQHLARFSSGRDRFSEP